MVARTEGECQDKFNPHMYIPDLSPYTFMNHEPNPNWLAVGWLDAEHEFPKGKVSQELLQKLLAACFKPVNQTRGIHQSPFLPSKPHGYIVEHGGKQMGLGCAEIKIPGKSGTCYAAPNLIYHYIKDRGYLPPHEFLDALNSI